MIVENELVIVVNSCDAYCDVWLPFFSAFNEFWPECKFRIILNTETKLFVFDGLNIVSSQPLHKDSAKGWGSRLKHALEVANSEYVFILFDDYILESVVDVQEIERSLMYLKADPKIAACYYISSGIDSSDDGKFPGYFLANQYSYYKINSAPALWRTKKLMQYTGDIDSPWAWEFFGTARTFDTFDKFYVVSNNSSPVINYQYQLGGAIHRGKWVGNVIKPAVERYNLSLDLNLRGVGLGCDHPHSLLWKIKFLWLGYRMIGLKVSFFLKNALCKRIDKVFKKV